MKKRTTAIFIALVVSLTLLVGCQGNGQLVQVTLDSEANTLTVDDVRYLRDESLISNVAGANHWTYTTSHYEQIASVKTDDNRYLINANEGERRFLFGYYDQYYFSAIPCDVWFQEELLEELSGPLTDEKLSCDMLFGEQFEQLLVLHNGEDQSDFISYEDMTAEIQTFEIENFRACRSVNLPHRTIEGLSFQAFFYFSVRTGTPYLQCRDGLFRPCPQELTDALELSPELPIFLAMTEDDPRLTPLVDELFTMYQTEGISSNELKRACGEDQFLRDLEFRIDIYSRKDDRWPLYSLKGYFHPQTGIPYLRFEDGFLRKMSQEAADSLGLQTAFLQQKETLRDDVAGMIEKSGSPKGKLR